MQLPDRKVGTCFFLPEGLIVNNVPRRRRRTAPVVAALVLVLFASGRVHHDAAGDGHGLRHDRLLRRKPLFGYKPMVYSIAGIAGLGFIVWGHHMFMSGMNPAWA